RTPSLSGLWLIATCCSLRTHTAVGGCPSRWVRQREIAWDKNLLTSRVRPGLGTEPEMARPWFEVIHLRPRRGTLVTELGAVFSWLWPFLPVNQPAGKASASSNLPTSDPPESKRATSVDLAR